MVLVRVAAAAVTRAFSMATHPCSLLPEVVVAVAVITKLEQMMVETGEPEETLKARRVAAAADPSREALAGISLPAATRDMETAIRLAAPTCLEVTVGICKTGEYPGE